MRCGMQKSEAKHVTANDKKKLDARFIFSGCLDPPGILVYNR